ncbi:hypothetical protein HYV43_04850 [Candidatus Micrarchaeota archaeon]|nr:hypothetical protein [Candidatus Micrarchaeota archaeon]
MNIPRLLANRKIQILIVLLFICTFLIFLRDGDPSTIDLNLGIEFEGGVRIPISLEKTVDAQQMSVMVDTIKTRINKFGLTQAVVRPLGNKEILVELPKAQASVIKSVESILRDQGQFEAIVAGKTALNSSHIIPTGIGGANGEQINPDGSWQLTFSVTGEGELHFATIASGHKGENVYMFLDRPHEAALLVPRDYIPPGSVITEALQKEGDDIRLYYLEDVTANTTYAAATLIIPQNLSASHPAIYRALQNAGYSTTNASAEKKLVSATEAELRPQLLGFGTGAALTGWDAIGLQSAPVLQVEPLRKATITQYSITGSAQGADAKELKENAAIEVRELKSVLAGGRLPVAASVGSYYNIAPTLGNQFLIYSFYGVGAAILLVAIVVTLFYRRFELILPIMFTLVIEIFVTITLLGALGTLDLAAMAGVIALIGSSVDNQIVITDELTKKRGHDVSTKRRFQDAFYIVFTTAGLAFASMLPLLLSGIVEIAGFAVAAILSVIVGILITRPAYAAVVEETLFDHETPHGGHEHKKE